MLQALVFDFDGLILETETPDLRSWQEAFARYGGEYPEWYWRFILGRGAEQVAQRPYELLVEQLAPKGSPVPSEAEFIACRREVQRRMLDELEVLPGVLELMDEAAALGLPMAVASSSRHAWVDRHLETHGLLERFEHVVCADDVERAKPFPDLYLEACRRLGSLPPRTVAFEDSANGCRAALEAGLIVVAVPTELTERADLDAHHILESLEGFSLETFLGKPSP